MFVNFISAAHTINCMTDNVMLAGHTQELFTMCDGAAKLQQAAEGQRGHMRFSPAVRLIVHILLELDPASALLPSHFMVLLHNQLVQLHKQLEIKQGRNISAKAHA